MEAPACNLFLLARSRHAERLIICFVYFYSMGLLAYRTEMENPGDVAAFNVFLVIIVMILWVNNIYHKQ